MRSHERAVSFAAGAIVLAGVLMSPGAFAQSTSETLETSVPAPAPAPSGLAHEVYGTAGIGYFGSLSRVVVGLGGGVGYRLHFNPYFAVYGEARVLWFAGTAGTAVIGAMATLPIGPWRPSLGLQLATYFGDQILVLDGANPDPPSRLAVAGQVRIAPLRFTAGRYTAGALGVDIGWGPDRAGTGLAVSITLLEVGMRF